MADTTPPISPTVTTVPLSASQVSVSWSTPSDDVVKYELRRDGKLISTQTTLKYFDKGADLVPPGLTAGHTYTYVVTAFDGDNNSSSSVPTIGMTEWWPESYDLPAFRVQRREYALATGGDYVRGSSVETLPRTALRYQSAADEDLIDTSSAAGDTSILLTTPADYNTVKIFWRWPALKTNSWQEVALVRSSYGHPSTPRDGQTVFRSARAQFEVDATGAVLKPPPLVYDMPLPSGNWYYYSLFFRTKVDWILGMSDACLLPNDYKHRDHMWGAIPPYYQWVDDNLREGGGHLRQFLTVFGFVMDNTRGFVEGLLDLHHIDKTPMPLLKGLGSNYGLPYEAGIGDIRYRGLVANAPTSQHMRGTTIGLEKVVEAVSKYQTNVTGSQTLMLFPDDSDFKNSTGNWGGMHPDAAVMVDPRVNMNTGSSVRLDGTAGSFVQGPVLSLGGTKRLRVEMDVSLVDWTPATAMTLIQQLQAPMASWGLNVQANGAASAFISPSGGTNYNSHVSPVLGYADGSRHVVGMDWLNDNGVNSFVQFVSDGADMGPAASNVRMPDGLINGLGPIEVGQDQIGAGRVNGNLYGFKIYADNVLIASPDFTKMAAGQRRVKDLQGNNWDLQGVAAVVNPVPPLLAWDKTFVARVNKVAPVGRGVMRVYTSKADELLDLLVLCGDSRIRNDGNPVIVRTDGLPIDATHPAPDTIPPAPAVGLDGLTYRDAIPVSTGIAIKSHAPYAFSAWVQAPEKGFTVQLALVWIGPSGDPGEVVGVSIGDLTLVADTDWHQYVAQGIAPAITGRVPEARYMIPAIHVYDRLAHTLTQRSAAIDVCGAMTYVLGDEDSEVSVTPPDRYLTLGDPSEKIGAQKEGFEGYIMGSPQGGGTR